MFFRQLAALGGFSQLLLFLHGLLQVEIDLHLVAELALHVVHGVDNFAVHQALHLEGAGIGYASVDVFAPLVGLGLEQTLHILPRDDNHGVFHRLAVLIDNLPFDAANGLREAGAAQDQACGREQGGATQ